MSSRISILAGKSGTVKSDVEAGTRKTPRQGEPCGEMPAFKLIWPFGTVR
jgi:hypothetical protein